jgi:hypothetical protein
MELYLWTLCNVWHVCWIMYDLGCMLVESRPFVVLYGLPGLYGLKYDSATAYGLLLYLCSYKLDGSATGGRFAVCTLAQSSLAYIFLPFATLKGWRIYPNSPIRWLFLLLVLLIDRFCYIENIYLVLLVSHLQANAWMWDLKITSAS